SMPPHRRSSARWSATASTTRCPTRATSRCRSPTRRTRTRATRPRRTRSRTRPRRSESARCQGVKAGAGEEVLVGGDEGEVVSARRCGEQAVGQIAVPHDNGSCFERDVAGERGVVNWLLVEHPLQPAWERRTKLEPPSVEELRNFAD